MSKLRIFKSVECGYFERENHIFIKDSEIQTRYNMFGMFERDLNYESNMKDWEAAGKPDDFSYEVNKSGSWSIWREGEPKEWFKFDADIQDCYFDDVSGFYWEKDVDEKLSNDKDYRDELEDYIEYITYWDGSNHKDIILTNEHGWCDYTEVTEEIGGGWEEDKQLIVEVMLNMGEYQVYIFNGKIWKHEKSYCQGSRDHISVVCDLDCLNEEGKYLLYKSGEDDVIEKYLLPDYISELDDGEEIGVEGGEIIMYKENGQYTFLEDEVISVEHREYEGSVYLFDIPLEDAREAIEAIECVLW